jgi:hypothetical protein
MNRGKQTKVPRLELTDLQAARLAYQVAKRCEQNARAELEAECRRAKAQLERIAQIKRLSKEGFKCQAG